MEEKIDLDQFIKKAGELNISDRDMLVETFRTVQHLQCRLDAMTFLMTVILDGKPFPVQPLTGEVATKMFQDNFEHALLLRQQTLASKYG